MDSVESTTRRAVLSRGDNIVSVSDLQLFARVIDNTVTQPREHGNTTTNSAPRSSHEQQLVRRRASLPASVLTVDASRLCASAPVIERVSPGVRRHSSTVVVPVIGAPAEAPASRTSSEFYQTFGPLGIPTVVAFLASAGTLVNMAVVQVFPTQIANQLMKTSDLDHGEFWLLSHPPRALVVFSTFMLTAFGCCYILLAYSMVRPQRPQGRDPKTRQMVCVGRSARSIQTVTRPSGSPSKKTQRVGPLDAGRLQRRRSTIQEFTSFDGIYHAYYGAMFDLPKLAFQTAALSTYLIEGFPLPLIYFYVSMLMTNWLISFYRFQRHATDRQLIVTRLFYLFDLFFAVFAPIFVIGYAYLHFALDREIFAIRERTLSPGMFERIARLFADPVQVDVFRYGFQHLQLTKTWYVAGKCCLNVLVVYKWKKIIAFLVKQRHANKLHDKSHAGTRSIGKPMIQQQPQLQDAPTKSTAWRATVKRLLLVHGRRRHLAFGITVFLSSMVTIPTYVYVAISSSLKSCSAIPQCRVVSYKWLTGADRDHCPCIVFIDRDQAPSTFDAWIHPLDTTQALSLAATSGHLKTVQIINRAVPELPIELKNCTELEQLILVYTKMQSLPNWVGSFHDLHYIHVESDFVNYPLHTLPLDMFAHTPKLRFIRFGGAAKLHVFPSLRGLHELSTLVLSYQHELTQFPDLTDLHNLKTFIVVDATHAKALPSLQPLKALTTFSLFRRNAMCCNGFITGKCDLTAYQCMPRANEDPVTCEDSRLPQTDRDLLDRIGGFVCSTNLTSDVADSEPTVYSTDTLCGGVRFKQCRLGGRRGMCYNGRMQVIHCDVFGQYEAMRRLQIAEGTGPACDPEVEAWLGCV